MSTKSQANLAEENKLLRQRVAELEAERERWQLAESELRESEQRLQTLVDYAPEAIVMLDAQTGQFCEANPNAEKLYGLSREQLLEVGPFDLSPPTQPDGRPSREAGLQVIQQALDGGNPVFEWWHCNAQGDTFPCEVRLVRMPHANRTVLRGSVTDISELKRMEMFQRRRSHVLEWVARGKSLDKVLHVLTANIESLLPGMRCSVLLLDPESKCLRHGSAPSLPAFYNDAVDGLKIGKGVGSCGTAAFTGERVIVADVLKHPYWEPFRDIAKQADFRACWSEPIVSSKGKILGTFAIYYREPREPLPVELDVIQTAARLAGIAIQRERTEKELLDLNRSLEQRIAQRTQELAEANAELARSNEELSQFASVASHDLHAPVRQVQSFCKLLREHYPQLIDEQANEWIDCIIECSEHMQLLVVDLLDYSRIDRQTHEFERVDLNIVVKQAMANLASAIHESAADITCGELPVVDGDAAQLVQLLQNLISNAVKFCDQPPPKIIISAKQQGDEWIVSMRDHGIGIDSKFHDSVFDVFKRLHSRDDYAGTGIGLSICKRVVDRHGGRIWVESPPEKGSMFRFTLPCQPLP